MVASRMQLFFHLLLLLLCCRLTQTKSAGPSAPPQPSHSPLPTESKTAVLRGEIKTERIEVVRPLILELECSWAGNLDVSNVTGFWSKDGIEIEDSHLTVPREKDHYILKRKLNIATQENLGNYSCVFGRDAKIDFVLAAPQMGELRDKPIVSYVGDTAVIACKMEKSKPQPTSWIWYKANGTEKSVKECTPWDYYSSFRSKSWQQQSLRGMKTQLVVHSLTEADSGSYYCRAMYPISSTLGHVVLKVITLHEPLKPFMVIVMEVTVLVTAILLYEKSRSEKMSSDGNENKDQTNTLTQGENDASEPNSSVRQRNV